MTNPSLISPGDILWKPGVSQPIIILSVGSKVYYYTSTTRSEDYRVSVLPLCVRDWTHIITWNSMGWYRR